MSYRRRYSTPSEKSSNSDSYGRRKSTRKNSDDPGYVILTTNYRSPSFTNCNHDRNNNRHRGKSTRSPSSSRSPSPYGRKRQSVRSKKSINTYAGYSDGSRSSSPKGYNRHNTSKSSPKRRNSSSSRERGNKHRGKENYGNHHRSKSTKERKSRKIPQHPQGNSHRARVVIYSNGNQLDLGCNMFVSEKLHPNWFKLLDDISVKLPLARPVYHLYTTSGRELHRLDQLEDGKEYVAVHVKNGAFIRQKYGAPKTWEKSLTVTHKDPKPLLSDETMELYQFMEDKEKGRLSARSNGGGRGRDDRSPRRSSSRQRSPKRNPRRR